MFVAAQHEPNIILENVQLFVRKIQCTQNYDCPNFRVLFFYVYPFFVLSTLQLGKQFTLNVDGFLLNWTKFEPPWQMSKSKEPSGGFVSFKLEQARYLQMPKKNQPPTSFLHTHLWSICTFFVPCNQPTSFFGHRGHVTIPSRPGFLNQGSFRGCQELLELYPLVIWSPPGFLVDILSLSFQIHL